MRRTPMQQAEKLIAELDRTNEFDEDLEPGYVAWLLAELVKCLKEKS